MRTEPHHLGWVVGVAVVLILAASLADVRAASALEPERGRVLGTYRFVGGAAEVDQVERAIDEAVEEMNVFIRGIARRRLKAPNLPTETLRITLEDGHITVSRTGQPPISAPADGKSVTWRNPDNGNELQVTHRMRDPETVEQVLTGDRGVSTSVFRSSEAGRLKVHTTIEADLLPSTVRFTTTYARQ